MRALELVDDAEMTELTVLKRVDGRRMRVMELNGRQRRSKDAERDSMDREK